MAELDLLKELSVADRKTFNRGHTLRKMGRGAFLLPRLGAPVIFLRQ